MSPALNRTGQRQTGSAGFTLLELMVVIAIASVLMALLLPALSSAKEKSRRCVCKETQHQFLSAFVMYVDDHDNDYLPSAADNAGAYHSIRLSDNTFTNLAVYLSGETNSFYCPNLVFATGQMGGHDAKGYIIGYSYLAIMHSSFSQKGPDVYVGLQKASETTGPLLADANYWSMDPGATLSMAPHSPHGSVVANAAVGMNTTLAGTNSAALGAAGGNIGFLDTSVFWRSIRSMSSYPAASDLSALANY